MANIKKYDVFDKKIIDLLISKSNISLQDLSKIIHRSKSFVNYRLKNLNEERIIEQIYPIINITKLGVSVFDLFIKTNMNEERETQFITYLKNKNDIYYIERLVGEYSIRISFFSKGLQDSVNLMREYLSEFSEEIENISLRIIKSIVKTQNPLFNTKKQKKQIEFFNDDKIINLNHKELSLLKQININPRRSILELSLKTKLSRDFISKTIKKFENNKMIVGYSADIDTEIFGYIPKLFLMKLKILNSKEMSELKNILISIPEIQTITTYFPEDYISIEVILKSELELRDLHIRLSNKIRRYIEKMMILDYYDEPKYSYMNEFLESLI